MSSKHDPIREITVSDEMLFPDVQSLTGVTERKSAGGFILRVTRSEKTVKYSASDPDGAPLQGRYLRVTDGAPQVSSLDQTCFYCVTTGGATYCTQVLCPTPA